MGYRLKHADRSVAASGSGQQRGRVSFRAGWLCLLAFAGTCADAGTDTWSDVAAEIIAHIDRAESLYQDGKPTEAGHEVIQAYFGVFEDRKMEAAMRIELGATHTYEVEQQFGALRKAIRGAADRQAVQTLAQGIRESVVRDARALDEAKISMDVYGTNP